MCSHKRTIQIISDRILIMSPCSCPRGGTWGCLVVKNKFPSRRYLLLSHRNRFNQIKCVSYSHAWGVQQQNILTPPTGALERDQKVKYHLISNSKSISKNFIPNCVCVLTKGRYKTNQTGFSFCHSRGRNWRT